MYLFHQALNHFLGAEMCTCLIETFSSLSFHVFCFFNCFIREYSGRHMKYTIPSHVGSFSDVVVCQKSLTETLSFLSLSCYPSLSFFFFSFSFFVSIFPTCPTSTFPHFPLENPFSQAGNSITTCFIVHFSGPRVDFYHFVFFVSPPIFLSHFF